MWRKAWEMQGRVTHPEDAGHVLVHIQDANNEGVGRGVLQLHRGEVDCAHAGAILEVPDQGVGDLNSNGPLGLFCRATNVGCHDHVRTTQKLRLKTGPVGLGLFWVHINRGALQVAVFQVFCHGLEVHDGAPGIVDQKASLLHDLELLFANHVLGLPENETRED